MHTSPSPPPPASLSATQSMIADTMPATTIFSVFSRLSLMGFGGVLPFAYRALVERHRWLSADEFARCLALSQLLPGPTICNVAAMVGNRYAGIRGAAAAVAGLFVGPFFIVIALGAAYQQFAALPLIRHALTGMTAAAAGLILATALKMAKAMLGKVDTTRRKRILQVALFGLAFVGLGPLKMRLVWVFCALVPLGTVAFYLTETHHE